MQDVRTFNHSQNRYAVWQKTSSSTHLSNHEHYETFGKRLTMQGCNMLYFFSWLSVIFSVALTVVSGWARRCRLRGSSVRSGPARRPAGCSWRLSSPAHTGSCRPRCCRWLRYHRCSYRRSPHPRCPADTDLDTVKNGGC